MDSRSVVTAATTPYHGGAVLPDRNAPDDDVLLDADDGDDDDDEDDEDEDDEDASSASASSPPRGARPELPGAIPALVLHKAVAAALDRAGFDGADPDALDHLEGALASVFGSLLLYAHDLAEHARRHVPTAVDVLEGCRHLGIGHPGDLLEQVQLAADRPPETETSLRLRYQRPRAPAVTGPLLPSDDDKDDDDVLLRDPLLASPPPSPLRGEDDDAAEDDDDDDDDFEFEEVTPLGPDGLPLPAGGSEATAAAAAAAAARQQQRRDAVERRRREKQERKERAERNRDARRAERERRRKERARRRDADPLRAEWLPALPPKHSWKQTPVYPESAVPPPIPPPISQTQQAPSAAALQHLSTLRARLNDSQLVAASLRNLIRKTRASATATATTTTATATGAGSLAVGVGVGAGVGGGGGGGRAGEQDSADVVDYESEWYGARGLSAATGPKRKIRVVTVGQRTNQSPGDLLEANDDAAAADAAADSRANRKGAGGLEGTAAGEASRVGGAVKRRRWLV